MVKKERERKCSSNQLNSNEMTRFSEFIKELKYIFMLVVGNKFNWFNLDGKAMSLLDRFLLYDALIESWKILRQFICVREFSDHCLLWIKGSVINWGPKPFIFFNCWIHHPDYLPFVENIWKASHL